MCNLVDVGFVKYRRTVNAVGRTPKITRRRREIVHLKTPDFAARVHFLDVMSRLWVYGAES